ncbi:DUF397 domain-containing protein [Streptomyces sp. NPDC057094]|uniref:DUF397 domain-containing protein n=1 Tax=Streptomyces sp. NPDC057094 TaxID=3346018 RepID=UPI00363298A2
MPEPLTPVWFKSSYSGGSGTECVECALTDEGTLIRDSKASSGPLIAVCAPAWRAFISSLPGGSMGDEGGKTAAPGSL